MAEQKELEQCADFHIHEEIVERWTRICPTRRSSTIWRSSSRSLEIPPASRSCTSSLSPEMCVCDIAQLLGMTQSAISHQLRALKQSKLVKYRREGKQVYYALADGHVRTILDQGIEHISE